MAEWWVSTPRWTALVVTDAAGIIRHCAPILRRQWRGKGLRALVASARQQYGRGDCRMVRLDGEGPETLQDPQEAIFSARMRRG